MSSDGHADLPSDWLYLVRDESLEEFAKNMLEVSGPALRMIGRISDSAPELDVAGMFAQGMQGATKAAYVESKEKSKLRRITKAICPAHKMPAFKSASTAQLSLPLGDKT